jgi:hypothetical protein
MPKESTEMPGATLVAFLGAVARTFGRASDGPLLLFLKIPKGDSLLSFNPGRK